MPARRGNTKLANKPKRQNILQEHLSQVVWFGGFPMRRGDVVSYLGEVAKSTGEKNWLAIRDAGLLGNYQYNEKHGYPPEGTEPINLSDFKKITKNDDMSLQSIESSRSPLSQSSDERQEHSLILDSDDPKVEKWKRDPGSADVRGIDTPKKHKSKHKSKREQTPTSLRRIGR